MLSKAVRLALAAALFWTGARVCLMPQADCEGRGEPPCHRGKATTQHCCTGVHLTEAAMPSGAGVAAAAQAAHHPALPVLKPVLPHVSNRPLPLLASSPAPPAHPPPRECAGRSPPLA